LPVSSFARRKTSKVDPASCRFHACKNLPPAPRRSPTQTWLGGTLHGHYPVREYSLDYYLLEKLRFSGVDKENLADLISIVASRKNKYGITPVSVDVESQPVPNGLTMHYLVDSITLHKLTNVLLDTPRLEKLSILPRGIPRTTQFELCLTLA